jgi:hypothetical protein
MVQVVLWETHPTYVLNKHCSACNISDKWHELKYAVNRILKIHHEIIGGLVSFNYKYKTYKSHTE